MAESANSYWNRQRVLVFIGKVIGFKVGTKDVEDALSAGFPRDAVDKTGSTLLHTVVSFPHLFTLVPWMMQNHWDPNAVNSIGVTPLQYACAYADVKLVRMLVEAGGRLDYADNDNWPALFYVLHAFEDSRSRQDFTALLEWLMTRPEVDWYHVSKPTRQTALTLAQRRNENDTDWRFNLVLKGQALQRHRESRWSPLRAAFVGAVAGCAV